MTDNHHPMTPPPELVREWIAEWSLGDSWAQVCQNVALVAARWGADQELEACCEWVYNSEYCEPHAVLHLRTARRPRPLGLKEQALDELQFSFSRGYLKKEAADTIRRALESLPD